MFLVYMKRNHNGLKSIITLTTGYVVLGSNSVELASVDDRL